MNILKKFIASILSVAILSSLLSINSFALTEHILSYELSSDGNSYICNGIKEYGNNPNITIPSTYNGKPVSEIKQMAFMSQSNITNITVSTGIKKLGMGCFADVKDLTSVTLPSSLTDIEKEIFVYCDKLSSVNLQDGIPYISYSMFYGCGSLTNITIPSSVTTVGESAFVECYALKTVSINGAKNIGNSAFEYCNNLTNVTLPNNLVNIGNSAFSGCENLTDITIPNTVTTIEDNAFNKCSSLTNIVLPHGVSNIGFHAFQNCTNLKSLTIPSSVTFFGEEPFSNCNFLNKVLYAGTLSQWNNITVSDTKTKPFLSSKNIQYSCFVPTMSSVTGNISNWQTKSVTLTANGINSVEGGLHEKPYSFSTQQGVYNWQTENTATFDTNQTVYVYLRDKVGNVALRNTTVINKIDTTAPTITNITGNPTDWTNSNVTLTVNGAVDKQSGLHETPYSFSTEQGVYNWQSENTATFDTNQTVYIYTRDKLGNIGLKSTQVINKYDNTAPTITDVTGNPTDWTNSNVTLTVNDAVDSQSGLHETPYSFSTEQGVYNWQSENTATFDTNQTVYIYVKDKAGNILLADTQTINKIDKIVPTITDVTGNPTDWTNKDITLTVNGAVDSQSGLHDKPYSFSTKQGVYDWQAENTATFDSNQTVYIYVKDKVGNIMLADTQTIDKIDKTVPTITDVTGNPTDWTNKDVTLAVNGAVDSQSGLHETPYSFSTEQGVYNWQAENTATFDSNQTVYIYVKDKSGNIMLADTQIIDKIDKTVPTITDVIGNLKDWKNDVVTLTVNGAVDSQSGLHDKPYSFSTEQGVYNWQAENTATFNTNKTVYIYLRDKVGNIALCNTQNINKIDNTAPTITDVTGNPTDWTNKDITLTVNGAVDSQSGLHDKPYSFSTEQGVYNWQAENTATFDSNQTVYIYVKDKVGNIMLADTQTIDKIDKTPIKFTPASSMVSREPIKMANKMATLSISGDFEDKDLHDKPFSFSTEKEEYNWQEENKAVITSEDLKDKEEVTVYMNVRDKADNITYCGEKTIEIEDIAPPQAEQPTNNQTTTIPTLNPHTGDSSSPIAYTILCLSSLAVLTTMKKKGENK